MWLLHVLGNFMLVSGDVVAFVALVGFDVAMDKVHVVPQLLVVSGSIDILVHLSQNCSQIWFKPWRNKNLTQPEYLDILLSRNFPFRHSWQQSRIRHTQTSWSLGSCAFACGPSSCSDCLSCTSSPHKGTGMKFPLHHNFHAFDMAPFCLWSNIVEYFFCPSKFVVLRTTYFQQVMAETGKEKCHEYS